MCLITASLRVLKRTFQGGICSIAFIVLFFITVFLCSNFQQNNTYSSDLYTRFLTLDSLPKGYVETLDRSIHDKTSFIFNNTSSAPSKIPRIIHQTYRTTNIPEAWLSAHNSCRAQNPDYQHFFWTDETARKFMSEHFEWFLPTYDNYPYPIERVDSIRYFLLWHFGGVYLDLDISCRRPLDPLLSVAAWFPKTQPFGVSNDIMASAPRHPLVIKLAMSLHDQYRRFGTGYTTVFWATGPMFVNKVLAGWFQAQGNNEDTVGSDYHVAILPPMFYDRTYYTFFGHREGSSWHGKDVAAVKWLYAKLWWIVAIGIVCSAMLVRQRKQKRNTSLESYQQDIGNN